MPTNDFLPFSPTDTGTNLLSQSDYLAASQRTIGNQPGVASSKLVNKAIRQAAYISSQFAQYLSDRLGTDVLDDATPAKLLAQVNAVAPLAPTVTNYLSGSGTHYLTYIFFIATGSATVGATYTNNAFTFTVKKTVASGLQLIASGTGAPSTAGVLTKATGTGDAAITFFAVRAPLSIKVRLVGGAGGGAGSGTSASGGSGSDGTDTTFGTLTAGHGGGGNAGTTGGTGGTPTVGSGWTGVGWGGAPGGGGMQLNLSGTFGVAGTGGASPFGGAGSWYNGSNGSAATPNSGSGGGGGSGSSTASGVQNCGAAGGAGAYLEATNTAPSASYAYSVGPGGGGGSAGSSGQSGGAGGSGIIMIEERYQ